MLIGEAGLLNNNFFFLVDVLISCSFSFVELYFLIFSTRLFCKIHNMHALEWMERIT